MILVTGSTGHVGRQLVPMLLERRAKVRLLVRDASKVARWKDQVEIALGDLDVPETLSQPMADVDKLYFVTPITEQAGNLVTAAKQAGVSYVVKQSTIEAGRALGPGKWHRDQEKMIEANGFDWTFLRPTMFMSNTAEWWAATIKAQEAVYFPGGNGRVPAVASKNVAAVAAAVLTEEGHEGKVYEITGPHAHSIKEMIQIISKYFGKPIRYTSIPPFLAAFWLRSQGMSGELVKGLMQTLAALRKNEYAYVTDVVEKVGGITPTTYEEWVRKHIELFQ